MSIDWAMFFEGVWVALWLVLEPYAEKLAYKIMKRRGRKLPSSPSVSLGWWPIVVLALGILAIISMTEIP